MHLFKQGVKFVSAPGGFILDIVNREKMQHVMQKKWIVKMQTKRQLQKKHTQKKKHKCTKKASAKTQCKTNINQK
jgi:hypothetical protein